jgi:hypothetical protein
MESLDGKGIIAICVLLSLHLLKDVGKFLYREFVKKSENFEKEIKKGTQGSAQEMSRIDFALIQNTNAIRELKIQTELLAREVADLNKMKSELKIDVQKVFTAVKIMAGPKWSEVRKKLSQDNLP